MAQKKSRGIWPVGRQSSQKGDSETIDSSTGPVYHVEKPWTVMHVEVKVLYALWQYGKEESTESAGKLK